MKIFFRLALAHAAQAASLRSFFGLPSAGLGRPGASGRTFQQTRKARQTRGSFSFASP